MKVDYHCGSRFWMLPPYFNFLYSGGWSPLGTVATNRPVLPAPGDYDDGEIGGMLIVRGTEVLLRKPAPVPLRLPQAPHAARTTAVGSQ
jgi:hypothetical protein